MKIAITSTGKDLEANVDFRFGRCPYFVIVDTDDLSFDVIENKASSEFGGAGVRASQEIIKSGAKAVITGNVGPNAYRVLSSAGIKIFEAPAGTKIKEVIEKFKRNELKEINASRSCSHFGVR